MASLPSPSWLSAASGCDRARPGGCDAWLFASPRDLGGDTLQRLRAAVKAQERSGAPSSRIVADTLHLASRDFESWYLPALDLRHGSRLLERSRNQLSDQKSHADPDRTNDHAAHRSLPPGRGYSRDGAGTVIHACRAGESSQFDGDPRERFRRSNSFVGGDYASLSVRTSRQIPRRDFSARRWQYRIAYAATLVRAVAAPTDSVGWIVRPPGIVRCSRAPRRPPPITQRAVRSVLTEICADAVFDMPKKVGRPP